jgi:crotonobetainyl-CoA:carnitine CoA-transferase CaiB-like acyl-CoA transferase
MRRHVGSEAIEVVAPAVSFSAERWPPLPLPGAPGRDGDEVLRELGVAPDRISALREQGVVG